MVYFIFRKYYKKNSKKCRLPNNAAVEGVYCVAHFQSQIYHRVVIVKAVAPLIVRCWNIDHGSEWDLDKMYLWYLHKDFKHIPNQAIKAEWYGAMPARTQWTPDDLDVFEGIIDSAKKLEAKVENYNNQVR